MFFFSLVEVIVNWLSFGSGLKETEIEGVVLSERKRCSNFHNSVIDTMLNWSINAASFVCINIVYILSWNTCLIESFQGSISLIRS